MGLLQTARQSLPGPQMFALTLDLRPLIGGNIFDLLQTLPFPCNTIFLASVQGGDEANSLAVSLVPTGIPTGTSFTALTGNQSLIFLTSNLTTGPFYRTVIRFKEPVTRFFLHIGGENGHFSRFTLLCTNDEQLELVGGVYT